MKNILMVIHGIKFTNGGITKVMLNRSHFLSELGHRVSLVTFDNEENYPILEKKLKDVGRLHKNSKIINFFEFYHNKNLLQISDERVRKSCFPQNNALEDNFLVQHHYYYDKKFIRYFNSDGDLVKCKYWSPDLKMVERIDYYERTRVITSEFFTNNLLVKKIDYNESGEDIQCRYFTQDGFCFFQRSFLGEKKILHLFLFDRNTLSVVGFNSYQALHTHFIEELCDSNSKVNNIVICDGPGSTNKVANVSSSKAVKFLTIHSNHLSAPYTEGAPIKEGILPIFENLDKCNAVIVLTKSQEKDLQKMFRHNDVFHFIPNTVEEPEYLNKKSIFSEKIRTVNIISRYVEMKRLKDIISAIHCVVCQYNVPLDLIRVNFYGAGVQKTELIEYVKKLELSEIITINDYATDVNTILRNSHITVMTSKYEGFGLTIIEAMANKTPVIAYDINYGPRDIISDGVDGFLVKSGDIKALSKKIYDVLFENYEKLPEISEKAYEKIVEQFTHEYAKKLWEDLLKRYE